jgi:hypothetical protein
MSFNTSRNVLFGVFLIFFVISMFYMLGFLFVHDPERIADKVIFELFGKVIPIYLIPLSTFITGYFGEVKDLKKGNTRRIVFWMALSLSIVWNFLLIGGLAYYFRTTTGDITPINDYISYIITPLMLLVTAPLAYFFTAKGSR